MADYAAKADDYRRQAEKKLKNVFGGLFGSTSKYEDAAELFEKAANNYKLAKCGADCAEMYEKLAECHVKMDSKYEAASALVEAAKAGSKQNPAKSQELLQRAVDMYTDMGRLNMAARQLREIGETNEKSGQKPEAMKFYTQAADLFETEGSNSDATKCKLKIAEISAELGKYHKAAELFEEAAKRAVENNLLKFSARGYLLQAGICLLCVMSPDDLEIKLDKYRDIDLQFAGSREATLLEQLLEAMQGQDDQKFATALAEYDTVTRLDAWKTKILLEAKRRIQDLQLGVGGGEDGGGGDDDDVL